MASLLSFASERLFHRRPGFLHFGMRHGTPALDMFLDLAKLIFNMHG